MSSSPLAALETAPIDPIISVSEAFFADANPNKVNLGIGIYCDDSGKVPVLDCIKEAEKKFVVAG
jgi:aromatic-amino-acid transaminase